MSHEPETDPSKSIGKGMMYVAWIMVLGLLSWFFGIFETQQHNPNQSPSALSQNGFNEVRLKRNAYGHYVSTGSINQQQVTFLLDTGATHVSIPENLADELGLRKLARGRSSTANGYVETFLTRIDTLRLGNITAYDVPASINPGMNHSEQILLGMSVLKNVEFSQKGDILTIRQY